MEDLLERVELDELALFADPICEDDHELDDPDLFIPKPPCSHFAVATMMLRCNRDVELVCANIAEWFGDGARIVCTECGRYDCITTRPL